jgi:hypothetical protein
VSLTRNSNYVGIDISEIRAHFSISEGLPFRKRF